MDRDLAVELKRDATPHYYHGDGEDVPGAYFVPAALYERVLTALRGETRDWQPTADKA